METRDSNGTDGDLRLCVPESAGSRTFANGSSYFISRRGDTLNMSGAHLANLCDLERTPTPFVTFTNTRRGGFKEGQIARRLMPGANVRSFPSPSYAMARHLLFSAGNDSGGLRSRCRKLLSKQSPGRYLESANGPWCPISRLSALQWRREAEGPLSPTVGVELPQTLSDGSDHNAG